VGGNYNKKIFFCKGFTDFILKFSLVGMMIKLL
jgi:hypothetical protein